jgi:hypothetical protein
MTMLMLRLRLDRQAMRKVDHGQEKQEMMNQVDEMEKLRELLTSDLEEMVVGSHYSQM